jgi:hypothetical protein
MTQKDINSKNWNCNITYCSTATTEPEWCVIGRGFFSVQLMSVSM